MATIYCDGRSGDFTVKRKELWLSSRNFTVYSTQDVGSIVGSGSWLMDLEQMIWSSYIQQQLLG